MLTGAALGIRIDGAHNIHQNLVKPCLFSKNQFLLKVYENPQNRRCTLHQCTALTPPLFSIARTKIQEVHLVQNNLKYKFTVFSILETLLLPSLSKPQNQQKCCNFVQSIAISCIFLQLFAILYNYLQFCAITCNFVQLLSISCNT